MIEVSGLSKHYGQFKAVDDISFKVGPGEIVGLVGPNGAGKTSTLRCITGIIPPTSGSIALSGFDLHKQPVEAKLKLAFIPDEPHLFDHLTSWDYLRLLGRLYQVDSGEAKAEALLERVDLSDRKYAFPSELSRGMKQKLMIAGALLQDPKAFILDEPLTGLDPRAMRAMKDTVVEEAGKGAAVLVSSHMLHLVEEICSRVIIIHQGKIVLQGSLEEIRRTRPEAEAGLEAIFLSATEEHAMDDDA